jgi:hypothetical protein
MDIKEIELKSWPKFFQPIINQTRTHELRRNDRNFKVGDQLILREYDPDESKYTGRRCKAEVTSITSSEESCAVSREALHPEFCILSINVLSVIE